jgi:periplasmic protein TonB
LTLSPVRPKAQVNFKPFHFHNAYPEPIHNNKIFYYFGCMKILTPLFLLTLSITAKSQKDESFYVFDADWKPTKIETAHFLLHTHRVSDTCWQYDFYNFLGPLIKVERYRDKDANLINGVSRHYNEKGLIDSTGNFHNGKRNGEFIKFVGDPLKPKWKYIYREDSLIDFVDLAIPNEDPPSFKDEKESDYPGGAGGWMHYLQKHLKYPERAMNGNIQGQVSINFVVDIAGNVIDPYVSASVEYSLDDEALKMINGSGKWEPAFQNGKNVKSYKLQPINFRLE